MRLLIATPLYPPDIGGPATYTRALEQGLPAYGIVTSVIPFSRVRRLPKVIRHIWYFFILLRNCGSADIVYAQDPVSVGFPALCAAKILGKKFILKVVGDYAWEQASQRSGFTGTIEEFQHARLSLVPAALRSVERYVACRAERVVVPSKYLAGIVSTWGVKSNSLTVIYNGMEDVGDTGNKSVLRDLIGFHGSLVVSVGRLVPWKGFRELISIVGSLKKNIPDLKLLVIGSGPDLASLEEEAVRAGCKNDVIFTGALPRDSLLKYIHLSDVFVLNTRYEGFSHLLLEVMAVSVPVITTTVGGNPEIVTNEKNGYLVEPNDSENIALHIQALLTDSKLREDLVTAGKHTALQFSVKRMLTETAEFLHTL